MDVLVSDTSVSMRLMVDAHANGTYCKKSITDSNLTRSTQLRIRMSCQRHNPRHRKRGRVLKRTSGAEM